MINDKITMQTRAAGAVQCASITALQDELRNNCRTYKRAILTAKWSPKFSSPTVVTCCEESTPVTTYRSYHNKSSGIWQFSRCQGAFPIRFKKLWHKFCCENLAIHHHGFLQFHRYFKNLKTQYGQPIQQSHINIVFNFTSSAWRRVLS